MLVLPGATYVNAKQHTLFRFLCEKPARGKPVRVSSLTSTDSCLKCFLNDFLSTKPIFIGPQYDYEFAGYHVFNWPSPLGCGRRVATLPEDHERERIEFFLPDRDTVEYPRPSWRSRMMRIFVAL